MTDNQTIPYEKISEVCKKFMLCDQIKNIKLFTSGHINSTYCVELENGKKYVVRNINTGVFENTNALCKNVVGVTEHIKKKLVSMGEDPQRQVLSFLKTNDGDYFFKRGKNCFRIYEFVPNTKTVDKVESCDSFCDAGRRFGRFRMLLADYDMNNLEETIPNFHNTPKRFEDFLESIKKNPRDRVSEVEKEIEFVVSRKDKMSFAVDLLNEGKIPLRVTHNDTKINNILFDTETEKAVCVIDLDTVMPGLSLYDFGDAMRTGAATALENERDFSLCGIDLNLFKAYTVGYLSSCKDVLTKDEIDNFAKSAHLLTLECGMRFLKDYIDGDVYFTTKNPDDNLVRARNRFAMVLDIEKKLDEMEKIVREVAFGK